MLARGVTRPHALLPLQDAELVKTLAQAALQSLDRQSPQGLASLLTALAEHGIAHAVSMHAGPHSCRNFDASEARQL